MSTDVEPPASEAMRMFLRNRAAVVGAAVLALVIITAVFGPLVQDADPFAMVGAPMSPPLSPDSVLGTDYMGRDVLTGLVYGGRATLIVGTTAALLSVFIGVAVGALAGYFGGTIDEVLMRFTEFFQVLPALLFAMVLVTLFSPSLSTVAFAIGMSTWTGTARLARAEFLKLKQLDFVRAEHAMGAGHMRIIGKVILPNALPPLVVSGTLAVGAAILFAAGLSFLGLADPNTMTWGLMIGSSRQYILSSWWSVTFPGIAIFVTVLCVTLVGDGLNDALNPKLRDR
ncbi:MAG TPA: ABC transporter permease [Burkholderiales bacterium]|nr:ABC transporter permease [Burkholderiales bacterium]